MIILFDTNILIQREDNQIIPENISKLQNILEELAWKTVIHPASYNDIANDRDEDRRKVNISKFKAYLEIETPPTYENDFEFQSILGKESRSNDYIDNALIYAVYKEAVHYLITEDKGILAKAVKLGLENRILNVNEAIISFQRNLPSPNIDILPAFTREKGYNLNLEDDIFNTLREEYKEFDEWWTNKVCKDRHRHVWVCKSQSDKINAILVLKIETKDDFDNFTPPFNDESKLKICLFKVAESGRGLKIGERLIKMSIEYAIENSLDEIYLTHFIRENDELVFLIEQYGFCKYATNDRGEEVFLKKISCKEHIFLDVLEGVLENNIKFFPSFYDGEVVKKHIVPITPLFHEKLFPDYKYSLSNVEQLTLFEKEPIINSEGNSIKKAYICNAQTKKIKEGDILLFYRTDDLKSITTIGTVEKVYYEQTDPNEIFKLITKRTVFDIKDIITLLKSPVLVILFKHNFHLENDVSRAILLDNKIINGSIQSIQEVSHCNYKKVIEGNIDERFIIN